MVENLSLKIHNLKGPDSLTKRQALAITRSARGRIRSQLGIKLTYSYQEYPDPFVQMDGNANRAMKYFNVFGFVKQQGHAPQEINLVLLGPVHDLGTKFTTGGSSGIGMLGKPDCTAIVSCWIGNEDLARLSILHELGHILGAKHTETLDIMNKHPAILPGYENLKYGEASKLEIKNFLESLT